MNQSCVLPPQPLRMLWLKVTSRCNLRCVHCYADAGPTSGLSDALTTHDFLDIITAAGDAGCRSIQFSGGEPTLFHELDKLIAHAQECAYDAVEVYTNATHLSASLITCFIKHQTSIAVSLYADDPTIHDRMTQHPGSHAATIASIRGVVASGLRVRVGIILSDDNAHRERETIAFAHALGVSEVGVDHVRGIGRGAALLNKEPSLQELCGACWRGSVCVFPDGMVAPCIMSRPWAVGSVRHTPFGAIITSEALHSVRARIYNDVWLTKQTSEDTDVSPVHANCGPYQPCYPMRGCPPNPCGPNDCVPFAGPRCRPEECAPTTRIADASESLLASS